MDACTLVPGALTGEARQWSRRSQMFAAVVVVAVVGLMVAGRHPSVLEALRPHDAATAGSSAATGTGSPVTMQPIAAGAGQFQVRGTHYAATFDASGFRYLATGADQALGIAATSVARGRRSIGAHSATGWRADGAVIERPLAPSVTERVTARSGEVEWDVVVGSRPAGDGPLRISAALRGTEGYGSPAVVDGRAVLRVPVGVDTNVLVGQLVVRDALGKVLYRALPSVSIGHISLSVPASVLDGARYPLTVDPTVSSELTIAPAGARLFPDVAASTPTYFLTVWQEKVGTQYDIYGVLTDADVTVDPQPFVISSNTVKDDVDPHVAYNGNTFLVTWTTRYSSTDYDVRAQRVSKFGGTLGGVIGIATPSGLQYRPTVAGNVSGGPFLVAYTDGGTTDSDVKARRVNDDGSLPETSAEVLNRANDPDFPAVDDTEPAAAYDGQGWIIDWLAGDHIQDGGGVELWSNYWSPSNSTSDESAGLADFELNGDIYQPAVAGAGDGTSVVVYGIIKSGLTNGEDLFSERQFQRLFEDERQTVSTAANNESDPSIAFSGGTYLVAWTDRRQPPDNDIQAARIKKDGTVEDVGGFNVAHTTAYEQYAAVAPTKNTKWAVVYSKGTSTSAIQVRTVSPK